MYKRVLSFLFILIAFQPGFSEDPQVNGPDPTDGRRRDPDFQRFDPEKRDALPPELQDALEKAERAQIWNEPRWHRLMHYEKTLSGGVESEADAYEFFFSATGKTNPRNEVLSTLMAFYLASPDDPEKHPICHFPARFMWLSQKLQLQPPNNTLVKCSNLRSWLTWNQSRSVSVVFATYYGSNPASMYGHTFLKLNSRKEDPLLDNALNYAATPGDVDPVRYALYGLMGGFPGFFSMMPYHMKVREYSDLESRDLWEYELNLNHEERQFMLLHAWELGGIYFDYYYLSENCSYHILSLIEVARPDVSLKYRFPGWVLPAETVKALFLEEGLLKSVEYRPSLYNQIVSKLGQVDESRRATYSRLMESESSDSDSVILGGLSKFEQAEILDLALKSYLYRKESNNLKEGDKENWTRLMRRRAELPGFRTDPLPEIVNSPPEAGHGPMNVRLGAGSVQSGIDGSQSASFASLFFRPVLHDYLGPQSGYEPYSVFEFLTGELRFYDSGDESPDSVQLERFHLLRVESYSPVGLVRSPWSYSVDFGMEREQYLQPLESRSEEILALAANPELLGVDYALDTGLFQDRLIDRANPYARVMFGMTFQDQFGDISPLMKPLVFSVLAGVSVEGTHPEDSGLRLAPMGKILIQGQFDFLRIGLEGEYRALDGGRFRTGLSAGYSFSRNQELRLVTGVRNWKKEVGLSYSYYF